MFVDVSYVCFVLCSVGGRAFDSGALLSTNVDVQRVSSCTFSCTDAVVDPQILKRGQKTMSQPPSSFIANARNELRVVLGKRFAAKNDEAR